VETARLNDWFDNEMKEHEQEQEIKEKSFKITAKNNKV